MSNNSRHSERSIHKSPSNSSRRDERRNYKSPRNDRRSSNDSYRQCSPDRYQRSKSPNRPEPTCHGCGVKGHYIAKCPDAPDRCTACKGLYHTIDECPVEIRKTRPIAKKTTRRRSRDDESRDKRKPRNQVCICPKENPIIVDLNHLIRKTRIAVCPSPR